MDKADLVPVGEFDWTDDYSYQRILTCKNHPTARYSTKNPWMRSLGVIRLPEGDIPRTNTGECTCPFRDLVVIVSESQPEE
ncbi:hypothetical protein [Streptomyces sp. NPDC048142]|uniref:hypothetical protein n=1 Tax=Streptomyces sp. NPDC048142 TaxID=3365501 RepID=UPI003713BAD2